MRNRRECELGKGVCWDYESGVRGGWCLWGRAIAKWGGPMEGNAALHDQSLKFIPVTDISKGDWMMLLSTQNLSSNSQTLCPA